MTATIELADVRSVAASILTRMGPITAMKLQRLVYYCQAWHLVWEDELLFPEEIQAWATGPTVPTLYSLHTGEFKVSSIEHDEARRLTDDQSSTVDGVLEFYGCRSTHNLNIVTRRESPWRDARWRVYAKPGESATELITTAEIFEYYDSL